DTMRRLSVASNTTATTTRKNGHVMSSSRLLVEAHTGVFEISGIAIADRRREAGDARMARSSAAGRMHDIEDQRVPLVDVQGAGFRRPLRLAATVARVRPRLAVVQQHPA